jgi:4-carboxymuconolactone decarboxylase
VSEDRFPALTDAQMTPRQKEVAETIAGGPRGGLRGPFVALLHHPELADRVQQLGEHLRYGSTLPPSLIELAILVTARHWDCQYEWFAHERVARTRTDLPDAVIRAVQAGLIPETMSDDERVVHDFAVGAVRRGAPSDASHDAVAERFGRQGVLDLLATCGYYTMIAMVLNTARIPLPEGTVPPLRERH